MGVGVAWNSPHAGEVWRLSAGRYNFTEGKRSFFSYIGRGNCGHRLSCSRCSAWFRDRSGDNGQECSSYWSQSAGLWKVAFWAERKTSRLLGVSNTHWNARRSDKTLLDAHRSVYDTLGRSEDDVRSFGDCIHNPVLEISAGRAGVKHNACRSWRFYLDVESLSRFGHGQGVQ